MKPHDWEKTHWQDEQGNTTTIQDVLFELQNEPTVELRLSDLDHIPSTYIEDHRKLVADLSFPIIVQEKNGVLLNILDGHHRRQKALEEKRIYILGKIYKGEVISD